MFSSSMSRAATRAARSRWLHASPRQSAITSMRMPAMSPTMNEGGISSWKKKEGDSFTAGDVILEIETDKATIDVEAQEDGILGKILAPDGTKNIPVGKAIALLAEEGDDISNLEVPEDEPEPKAAASESAPSPKSEVPSPSPPSPAPSAPAEPRPHKHIEHSRPLFPSVMRLLQENDIPDLSKIKGTGVRGMLTKGDVLAYLGKASSPTGTYKEAKAVETPKKAEAPPPLDGPAVRRLIVESMYQTSLKKRAAAAPSLDADFDSIISDYLPPAPRTVPSAPPAAPQKSKAGDFLAGLI